LHGWHAGDWLVPFRAGYALVHHAHDDGHDGSAGGDRHALCGPLVFCCQQSRQHFLEAYPESGLGEAAWEHAPADQLISWMDAGVQVVYLVYCAPEAPHSLAAAALSGRQARLALQKLLPAGELTQGSGRMLGHIAGGVIQALDDQGGSSIPALSLA
jgi:hypothetical protein